MDQILAAEHYWTPLTHVLNSSSRTGKELLSLGHQTMPERKKLHKVL